MQFNPFRQDFLEIAYFVGFAGGEVGRIDDELGGVVSIVGNDLDLIDLLDHVLVAPIDIAIAVILLDDKRNVDDIRLALFIAVEPAPDNVAVHRVFENNILIDPNKVLIRGLEVEGLGLGIPEVAHSVELSLVKHKVQVLMVIPFEDHPRGLFLLLKEGEGVLYLPGPLDRHNDLPLL